MEQRGFRPMRRKAQTLSAAECEAALRRGTSGVLALHGDGGYPYAVPLSYAYENGRLYFHCARSGHKLDAIRRDGRASFCVIDADEVAPEAYTTLYRSVIVFGRVRVLEDEREKRAAIERLARRYAPDDTAAGRAAAIAREWDALCLLELCAAHMSGKEAIELVRARRAP